jgi:hypothetical protein
VLGDHRTGEAVGDGEITSTEGHADPRTTTRYDRARRNLDRHAVYILAS